MSTLITSLIGDDIDNVFWTDASTSTWGWSTPDQVPTGAEIVDQTTYEAFEANELAVAAAQRLAVLQANYDDRVTDLVAAGFTQAQAEALAGVRP